MYINLPTVFRSNSFKRETAQEAIFHTPVVHIRQSARVMLHDAAHTKMEVIYTHLIRFVVPVELRCAPCR